MNIRTRNESMNYIEVLYKNLRGFLMFTVIDMIK